MTANYVRSMIQRLRRQGLLRWYLLIVPPVWAMIFASLGMLDEDNVISDGWAIFLWTFQGLLMMSMLIMAGLFMKRMFRKDGIQRTPSPDIFHLVLLPCYKEPLEVISSSIDSIVNQTTSTKGKVVVVVSLEERSPDTVGKRHDLWAKYASEFLLFDVTVHPYGLENEIAGKCSNDRWAVVRGKKLLEQKLPDIPLTKVVMTSMDVDTILHRNFLTEIGLEFEGLAEGERHASIWQAGQFFNWGLARSGFITRITAIYRTIWMLGFNIPMKVHAMSVFSSSLILCIRNDYFDPRYPMDDLHYSISCMAATHGNLKLRPIYLPIISGPTSGSNSVEEIYEWGRQAHRWSVGAFEIFHCVIANMRELGVKRCLQEAGTIFIMYGFFQAVMAIVTFLSFPFWAHGIVRSSYPEIWLALTVMPFVFTAACLVIDGLFVRRFKVKNEKVGLFHNLKDLILSPIVLIIYNAVALVALHHLILRGRAVCTHEVSSKEFLGKQQAMF